MVNIATTANASSIKNSRSRVNEVRNQDVEERADEAFPVVYIKRRYECARERYAAEETTRRRITQRPHLQFRFMSPVSPPVGVSVRLPPAVGAAIIVEGITGVKQGREPRGGACNLVRHFPLPSTQQSASRCREHHLVVKARQATEAAIRCADVRVELALR